MTRLCVCLAFVACAAVLCASAFPAAAQERRYYIAADQVSWNYVPGGVNGLTGKPYHALGYFAGPSGPEGPPVAKPVSTSYIKCLYREYTDASFHTLKPRPPRWQHLGFFGPLIRAEVGDTVRIAYRNNCSFPNSIHVHGLRYAKNSEGAPYNDGTPGGVKAGDKVAPGGHYTYVYQVPERAGPGPGDGNSVFWMYHSHTDEYRDFNTGLVGPMIVTARGQSKADGSPKGVDREFVVWFSQMHEEDSWLVDKNLPTVTTDHTIPGPMTGGPASAVVTYPYFVTFSVNGYSFSTMPLAALSAKSGEHVRWYIMAGENDFDFHTPHWHGNTVLASNMRTDVVMVGPMQMLVADMVPDAAGTWLLHCHVAFHHAFGMNVRYTIRP
jgi:hephaestin